MTTYLWIVELSYAGRLHHGGVLRYFNLSRELIAQGKRVIFAVFYEDDRERCREWLDSLRADGVFTEHCEIVLNPAVPRWNKAALFLLPFGLHDHLLRPFLQEVNEAIGRVLKVHPADVLIISARRLIFAGYNVPGIPCIGDFTDSATLYLWREFRHEIREGRVAQGLTRARDLFHYFFREIYTSRRYAANIVVSPVDKRVFDWAGVPSKNVYIANGVRSGAGKVEKIANQIVFSGAMNFPPNYDGALWFLDHVFPLVLQKLPHVVFVIAGAKPNEALLARATANVQVSGFVPDLNKVLAESALYVAPLVSGSGFKNKVAEAITNGTYVIGTSFATEFLEPAIKDLITITDDPRKMAQAIVEFLSDPARFDEKLASLQSIVMQKFSWPAKAAELAQLADSVALSGAKS